MKSCCRSQSGYSSKFSKKLIGFFGILLITAVGLAPLASSQVKETPREVRNGSAELVAHYNGPALRLVIGLQPPNMEQEQTFLRELQTKGTPEFHQFLTAAEWTKRFDPSEEDEQAVVDWAKSQGLTVTRRYPNRLLVEVVGSVSTIEKAFGLTINTYQVDSKSFFSGDRDPAIPSSLTRVIQSVGGLNNRVVMKPANRNMKEPAFPDYSPGPSVSTGESNSRNGDRIKLAAAMKKSRAKRATANITGGAYDPTDMYTSQAYDTYALYNQGHCCNPLGNPGQSPVQTSIAIATVGTQQTSDMVGFQAQYPYLAYNFQEIYVGGTPTCCDGEGTMDLEWSTAMSNSFGSYQDTAKVYMYDGINANFSTFNSIYNQMLSDGNARNFSTSWGCAELNCYDSSDMNTADGIFSSMVGQGWTLAAASGDQGAAAGCGDATAVQFPASDPNVVGSGGISLFLDSNSNFEEEVGWSGGPDGCGTNDGGSTGGYSAYFSTPGFQTFLSLSSRGVPDIALNADWYYTPQNLYFEGSLGGNGGTSIVAPEMAGFFANANSYLLSLGNVCGGGGTGACGPIGNGNYDLYQSIEFGTGYSNPFYDITSGCNDNDVTSFYGLTYYCAGTGWDPVTGLGSINMLQMAWAINWRNAGATGGPTIAFTGPTTGKWYNSDQVVTWAVTDHTSNGDPGTGIAGFTQGWDAIPANPSSEATPGSGNSFYDGPQYVNATTGCLDLTGADCAGSVGQGMHTVHVQAWNNMGVPSGDRTYGPIGYDSVPPVTHDTLSGTFNGTAYTTPVKVTLSATDASSGVAHTYYYLGTNPAQLYSAPFTISSQGGHNVNFYSTDVAGNVEGVHTIQVNIESPTSTSISATPDPSAYYQTVTFTAKVTPSYGTVPTGFVTFKNNNISMGSSVAVNSSGVATFPYALLPPGTNSITATYGGSGKDVTSKSAILTQTVTKANMTIVVSSSVNPSTSGESVKFTATVAGQYGGNPLGTVKFKDGSTIIATTTVNKPTLTATFTTSALTVGSHNITAVYEGSSFFNSKVSATLVQKVNH